MFENLTKTDLYAIFTGVFTASMIVSNIIAGKTFDFFSFVLPCGVVIFPIVYVINDVLAEIYGYEKARRVIILGFFINLIAVICYNITIWLPAPAFFENSEAFSIVLGSTFRLLIAGFVAYIVGNRNCESEIRTACKTNLPEYSQPASIIFLEEFPKTKMSKVDYVSLEHRKENVI